MIDPVDFARMKSAFERGGGRIVQGPEIDAFLKWREQRLGEGIGGVTFSAEEIWLPTNPTRTAVFEEFIHSMQHRTGMVGELIGRYGNVEAERLLEMDVAERLVRNRRAWRLPNEEIRLVVRRLRGLRLGE